MLCKGYLPVTRGYVIYSADTATRAQPVGRCQVNISHAPKGQVNNLLIFHMVMFSRKLYSLELKSIGNASSRLYIIRICKYYGYSIKSLDLLFQSLIVAVFTYAIEVWGCAFYSKYLSRIDKLFARCYKLGYCLRQYSILDIRRDRDMKLWQRISSTNTALSDLIPLQRTRQMRTRSHNYILPKVQTSRQ